MRILVTGGAGFIASHVVDAYLAAGHDVAVLDNLSSGKRENLPPHIPVYVGSVQDRTYVRQVVQEFQPDVINHHAAQIVVAASLRDSFHDAESNILGMNSILMAMIEFAPQAKLIYASSGGAMYGVTEEMPYTETSTPSPQSPYGLSKYVAEQYVWMYAKLHNLKATVLRYSNVYGPRQNPHGEAGVCAIYSDRMLTNQPVIIFGDGSSTRDYVFVGDAARANVAALDRGDGESFNIATAREVSITEVFDTLAAEFEYTLEKEYAPLREGEHQKSLCDNKKAREILGWQPEVSFKDGAAQMADWYKKGREYMALSFDKHVDSL
jgi:UDP-glucose 4-epimerase